jgi:hypothetical protein
VSVEMRFWWSALGNVSADLFMSTFWQAWPDVSYYRQENAVARGLTTHHQRDSLLVCFTLGFWRG